MEETNKPVDGGEIIERLDKLIVFFDNYAKTHHEKECPDPSAHRKRADRKPKKPSR